MKSRNSIEARYYELQKQLVEAKIHCMNCGYLEVSHLSAGVPEYCQGFQINIVGIRHLESLLETLKWVLDREENYIEIDDTIMDETIVLVPDRESHDYHKLLTEGIRIQDLEEPYRSILLNSLEMPVRLPRPEHDHILHVGFTIFPNGSVFRQHLDFNEIDVRTWNKDAVLDLLKKATQNMAQEFMDRYDK